MTTSQIQTPASERPPGRQVVWKFPLELTAEPQTIEAPDGARVVHFAMQGTRMR